MNYLLVAEFLGVSAWAYWIFGIIAAFTVVSICFAFVWRRGYLDPLKGRIGQAAEFVKGLWTVDSHAEHAEHHVGDYGLTPEDRRRRLRFYVMVGGVTLSFLIFCAILSALVIAGALALQIPWLAIGGVVPIAFGITFTIAHIVRSIEEVPPGQKATKYFLGRYLHPVKPGPTFVPLGCKLILAPLQHIVLRIGKPDARRNDAGEVIEEPGAPIDDALNIQSREPYRVKFASFETADWKVGDEDVKDNFEKSDPLNLPMTTDPYIVVRARIDDNRRFVETQGSVEHATTNIELEVRTVLQGICAQRTVAFAQHYIETMSEQIRDALEKLVGDMEPSNPEVQARLADPREFEKWTRYSWGLDIVSVRIESFGLPHRINQKYADAVKEQAGIAEAEAKAESAKREAEGEKVKRMKWGEGDAHALEAKRAVLAREGGKRMAELTAAENVAANTKLMMVPADSGNLAAALLLLDEVRGQNPPAQNQPQPPQPQPTPPQRRQHQGRRTP